MIALNDPIQRASTINDLIEQIIAAQQLIDPFSVAVAQMMEQTRGTSDRTAVDPTRGNGRVLEEVARSLTDRGPIAPRTGGTLGTNAQAPGRVEPQGFIEPLPGFRVPIAGPFPNSPRNLPTREQPPTDPIDFFVRDIAERTVRPRSFGIIR